jgi:hypothetical protein
VGGKSEVVFGVVCRKSIESTSLVRLSQLRLFIRSVTLGVDFKASSMLCCFYEQTSTHQFSGLLTSADLFNVSGVLLFSDPQFFVGGGHLV